MVAQTQRLFSHDEPFAAGAASDLSDLARAMFGPESAPPGLTREQLIDRIQSYNATASADYLVHFSIGALGRYLDHLIAASEPRGPGARWTRPGDTRAIQRFIPADGD